MKKLIGCIAFVSSAFVWAAEEDSPVSGIDQIYSYSVYGGGDVIVKLESNGSSCPGGYWLKKTDGGFTSNLSMVIAAYQAKTQVQIGGDTSDAWGGSGSNHCRANWVRYP